MIDVRFDYRLDCKEGTDPDKKSKRLKSDHCFLWSKKIPNSNVELIFYVDNKLICTNINGVIRTFSPDSITNCFTYWDKTKSLRENEEIKRLIDLYNSIDYTIGSSIIFPVHDIDFSSKWTINKARGCSRKICDRIDYTLECIRLYYLDKNMKTPLQSCFIKYDFFFELFGCFENYVKFFLLDDLVSHDYKNVLSFTGDIDFNNPCPNESNYSEYIKNNIDFINKRNKRIADYVIKL